MNPNETIYKTVTELMKKKGEVLDEAVLLAMKHGKCTVKIETVVDDFGMPIEYRFIRTIENETNTQECRS